MLKGCEVIHRIAKLAGDMGNGQAPRKVADDNHSRTSIWDSLARHFSYCGGTLKDNTDSG